MTLSRVLLLPVVLVLYQFCGWNRLFNGQQDFPSIPTRSRNSWSSDWSGTRAPQDSGASKMENKRQSLSINTTEVASDS